MEDVLLELPPAESADAQDPDPLAALAEALSGRGIGFTTDARWGTVTVGDYTVAVWPTCCPYAVYGKGDWLPRWQFDGLPALLQFLHEARSRAA